jgi:hypothetical protein
MGGLFGRSSGDSRLVLGFDAGCTACSELARRIEDAVGERLEVRSLHEPQVYRWREEALGEDAPWAPTLIEVRGEEVRAWTGIRMGVRLSRTLGPKDTWRVMQVLGEMNSGVIAGATAMGGRSLSRAQFLKGIGGAAVAISVLSGTGGPAAKAGASTSTSVRGITGDALVKVARRAASQRDVVNKMGEAWRDKVRSGSIIRNCQNGDCVEAINCGNCRVRTVDGRRTFSGDCVVIRAAEHRYPDGNTMIAVSYANTRNDTTVAYYEYDEAREGIKSEATVWRPEGENAVQIGAASHNGELDTLVPTPDNGFAVLASDPCGGCGVAPGSRYLSEGCKSVSVASCALAAGGCGVCVASCIAASGTIVLTALCIGCLVTSCPKRLSLLLWREATSLPLLRSSSLTKTRCYEYIGYKIYQAGSAVYEAGVASGPTRRKTLLVFGGCRNFLVLRRPVLFLWLPQRPSHPTRNYIRVGTGSGRGGSWHGSGGNIGANAQECESYSGLDACRGPIHRLAEHNRSTHRTVLLNVPNKTGWWAS